MKGTVAVCLKETIQKKGRSGAWNEVLQGANFAPDTIFTMGEDVPDAGIVALMESSARVMGWTLQQTFDEFAEYWMVEYGPRVYVAFFDGKKNAREFLETMDNVHIVVTNTMPNARPPRFRYEYVGERTMIMHYSSHRGMIDVMTAFIRGVGIYYKEDLRITKLSADKVQIDFLS
jgi:hypothetical protein